MLWLAGCFAALQLVLCPLGLCAATTPGQALANEGRTAAASMPPCHAARHDQDRQTPEAPAEPSCCLRASTAEAILPLAYVLVAPALVSVPLPSTPEGLAPAPLAVTAVSRAPREAWPPPNVALHVRLRIFLI